MRAVAIYTVVVVHLFAVTALAYPLVYRTSPWKSGATGKALMNMARATALLFFVEIVRYWLPFPGHQVAHALAVTYLGAAMNYQLVVMINVQRTGRRARQNVRLRLVEELEPYSQKATIQ